MKKVADNSFIAFIFFILFLCFTSPVAAQFYFGKNKVQYTDFDWHVITTDHFKIYFYPEEIDLAEIAARSAEESYKILTSKFNHEIYSPVPLIIYSNPNHFVQTNVTWSLLPENVAGFTEFIKGRVVVPFNGSYYDFHRIIRHELVHVFTLSKVARTAREYGRTYGVYPPLWFTEGIAEFWSRGWDSEADLIVRDMVLNEQLPSINHLWRVRGTFFMYKLGESICHFISDTYGEEKLTRLFDNWHIGNKFEKIVEYTIGDDFEELSKKWTYYLKKKYFPQLASLDLPEYNATKLTKKEFAVRPVPVTIPDDEGNEEQWVIYKANKSGYSAIYMMPASGNTRQTQTLLKGDLSSKFESLHLMTSGVDQYDNRYLTFSSKSKERDVLYLYDIINREIISRYELESLASVASPRFSPDGRKVVFTGNRVSGYSDLYILDLESGHLQRLTNDIYSDLDPCFGSEGRSIIFSSDRAAEGYDGYYSLYRLWLDDKSLERLTFGPYHDRGADESPDGQRIIFSSDRGEEKAFNIFSLDRDSNLRQLTAYITGAFDPRFGQNPDEIYFSAYQNLGFHVFKEKIETERPILTDKPKSVAGSWLPGRVDANTRSAAVKYQTHYSLDIAQSAVAYDGVYGTIGGVQAAVSDVLGNNTFIFLLANTAQNKDDFLKSFNFALTYLHRANRLNWGLGGYHFYDQYYNDYDGYYYERTFGGALVASYPISKFDRIESRLFLKYSDKDVFARYGRRFALVATQAVSYINDNTLWEATGPLEGRRLNITLGYSYDFKSQQSYNKIGYIDLRHYYRLKQLSCVASRFFAYSSAGLEPQRIYFGGSWSFRGFSRRHFYNRNILFNSEELRFPLINDLLIVFPIGDFRLRGIRGALFHDLGTAWDEKWRGWQGSFGASVRIALGYLVVLRFDFTRTHDFKSISNDTKTYFFFGWNF